MGNIRVVFQRLLKHNLKLVPDKIDSAPQIGVNDRQQFLGHTIFHACVYPNAGKAAAQHSHAKKREMFVLSLDGLSYCRFVLAIMSTENKCGTSALASAMEAIV